MVMGGALLAVLALLWGSQVGCELSERARSRVFRDGFSPKGGYRGRVRRNALGGGGDGTAVLAHVALGVGLVMCFYGPWATWSSVSCPWQGVGAG